jgi:uncharacterized protein DUF6879
MKISDLREISNRAIDHFRLETLPQYLVPQEEERFSSWKRGERRRRTVEANGWLRDLRGRTMAGQRWWRVRILDYPLVEYSKYELFGYQDSAAAGQETFVANRAWHADLEELREDFWIYDSAVVAMIYDEEGRFIRPEPRDDLRRYQGVRDQALSHAVPVADYLRKYEPDLIADPP